MKSFFFGFVPMMSSVFLSSKFVFILGNLIVVALVGESKIFSPVSSPPNIHVEYEESIKRCQRFQSSSTHKEKEPEKLNTLVEERVLLKMSACGDGDQAIEGNICKEQSNEVVEEVKEDVDDEDKELSLPEDQQFNKRADDFIARVNERRRFELLLCNGE